MIPFSAETKQGLQEIYKIIDDIIDSPDKPE
jgi:GTP-binding protein